MLRRIECRRGRWPVLEAENYAEALTEIRRGIVEIEAFLAKIGQLDQLDECPELLFLREWAEEVESTPPPPPPPPTAYAARAADG